MARLYHAVEFEFPQPTTSRRSGMALYRAPVTQSARDLTIRNGTANGRTSMYTRRSKPDAGSLDAHLQEILENIPANQLKSFA
jgi:hypothetical protein